MYHQYILLLAALTVGLLAFSHALKVWSEGNRLGAAGVFLLGVLNLAIPYYLVFIRVLRY